MHEIIVCLSDKQIGIKLKCNLMLIGWLLILYFFTSILIKLLLFKCKFKNTIKCYKIIHAFYFLKCRLC